jgi:hypothetical protein
MIDSSKVLYSSGNNNECYTPCYGIKPILKYIPKNWVVWCPFDTEDSEFVKLIRANGNSVIVSHINEGKDFFDYEPKERWNVIISNPPFTNKRLIFERALSFNKPFALLMSLTWLNDSGPVVAFRNKQPQLLKFDKRINYINNSTKKISFSSGYFCYNFLPNNLIFERLIIK